MKQLTSKWVWLWPFITLLLSTSSLKADIIFQDDFSGPFPGNWIVIHEEGNDAYGWGKPAGFEYVHCYTENDGSSYEYPEHLHTYMKYENIDLNNYTSAVLTFNYFMDVSEGALFRVFLMDQAGELHTIFETRESIETWNEVIVNLDQFANQSGLVLFFRFDSEEGSTGNGVYIDDVVIDAASNLCDLAMTSIEILNNKEVYRPGWEIDVSCEISNIGTGPSESYFIEFYASETEDVSIDGYYLGHVVTESLGPGENITITATGNLPDDLQEGNHYIGAHIFCANDVFPDNNLNHVPDSIFIEVVRDMAAVEVEILDPRDEYLPGDQITFRYKAMNVGHLDVDEVWIGVYLDHLDGYGQYKLFVVNDEPLAAQSIREEERTITLSSDIPEGEFRIELSASCSGDRWRDNGRAYGTHTTNLSRFKEAYVYDVPTYNQTSDDCAPVAATKVLAYWDQNPYNGITYWNIVDHGDASSGDVSPVEGKETLTGLNNDIRISSNWRHGEGTAMSDLRTGIESVCNNDNYRNNLAFESSHFYPAPDFSRIRDEIDSGRPFIYHLLYYGNHHAVSTIGYWQQNLSRWALITNNWWGDYEQWVNYDEYSVSIVTVTPGGTPNDHYENDDDFTNAATLTPEDIYEHRQTHNFYQPGDIDFIKFQAVPGRIYTISLTNQGSDCEALFEFYLQKSSADPQMVTGNDVGVEFSGSEITWRCDDSDVTWAYIKVWEAGSRSGPHTNYDVEVSYVQRIIPQQPGRVSPAHDQIASSIMPAFEWSPYQHGGDGENQAGYQIRVRNIAENNRIVYNTGFIQDNDSNTHTYAPGSYSGLDEITGNERISEHLAPGTMYEWDVRIRDTGDDWSTWSTYQSDTQYFSTPLPVQITITTDIGQGTIVMVDGVEYLAPYVVEWSVGTEHQIDITTPQPVDEGTRYIFNEWNPQQATKAFTYTVPSTNETITAILGTEYFLTIVEQPPAGGEVTPAPPGVWITANTNANVSASVAEGYFWNGWIGDLSTLDNPAEIMMDGPKTVTAQFASLVNVTVDTDPQGLSFSVDGTPYTTTQVFSWIPGSEHSVETSTPQEGGTGERFVFSEWSDGGGLSHDYVTPDEDITLTGQFNTQYFLTVISDHGNPVGQDWYDQDAMAEISVTDPDSNDGTRYLFTGWTGDLTGPENPSQIVMDNPKTVEAHWQTQHYLTVQSEYGDPVGQGWYNENATGDFSVTSPSGNDQVRQLFQAWSGDFTGASTSGSVTLDAPKTVTASWQIQYFIATAGMPTEGGTITPAPPGAWQNAGTTANVSAIVHENYSWNGWAGDLTTMDNPTTILMDGPKSVTARFNDIILFTVSTQPESLYFRVDGIEYQDRHTFSWESGSQHTVEIDTLQVSGTGSRHQFSQWSDNGAVNHTITVTQTGILLAQFISEYYLEITSDWGNPVGEGWYTENSDAEFSVTTPDVHGQTRYLFTQWTGHFTGTSAEGTIKMDGPKLITAGWRTQHQLTVTSDWGDPAGQGWHNENTVVDIMIPQTVLESTGIRHWFSGWQGTGEGSYSGTDTLIAIVMNNPITETASWITQYYLSMEEIPPEGGDVTPPPPGLWVNADSTVTLNATITDGYAWRGWNGDIESMENPFLLTMDNTKTVSAHFSQIVDLAPPIVYECYPRPEAVEVAVNHGFEFKLKDEFGDIDPSTLNIDLSGISIVDNGDNITGDHLVLTRFDKGIHVLYTDPPPFDTTGAVHVDILCQDNAYPPNELSYSYEFNIGDCRILEPWYAILPSAGGSVECPIGVGASFPETVFDSQTFVSMGYLQNPPPLPDSVLAVGQTIHLGPDGIEFPAPVRIVLPIEDATQWDADHLSYSDLGVYCFSTSTGEWESLPVILTDEVGMTITTEVNHFSYFQVTAHPQVMDDVPKNEIAQMMNYPNPVNPDEASTRIRYQLNKDATISIKIYDVSGGLVISLIRNEFRQQGIPYLVDWDGKNGQGNVVANNVYFCVLESEKGKRAIRKIAVLRHQ